MTHYGNQTQNIEQWRHKFENRSTSHRLSSDFNNPRTAEQLSGFVELSLEFWKYQKIKMLDWIFVAGHIFFT